MLRLGVAPAGCRNRSNTSRYMLLAEQKEYPANRYRKNRYYVGLGVMVVLFVLLFAAGGMSGNADTEAAFQGPVVIELFTSQGCSSCPPADAFLQEIGRTPEFQDKVIPLAFHVDYWNYLGWKDPFSKPAWTERQGDYVTAMGGATLYTPQLVIHGREETVGVRYGQIRSYIKSMLALPAAHSVKLNISGLEYDGKALRGKLSVGGHLPVGEGEVMLWAVIFENGRTTSVKNGENAGKTLQNEYIVRNMVEVARLQKSSNLEKELRDSLQFNILVDRSFNPLQQGIVLLAQEVETRHMLGATVQRSIE